jgi:hypothetical protein
MTLLAFHRSKSRLAVVTAAAEFALVYIIHLHAGASLFKLEDSGVAAIAIEHGGMKRMAEDRRIQAGGRIGDFFLERGHLMAFCAVCRDESRLSVMAVSAGIALVHLIHGNFCRTLLHAEEFWMAFAAVVFFCVILVREHNRHACSSEGEARQVVASAAYILVQVRFLMLLYQMALVAVHAEADVSGM